MGCDNKYDGGAVHRVIGVENITPRAIVVRVERHAFSALPGQHVTLGLKGAGINREYSIYEQPEGDELHFLIKVREISETAWRLQHSRAGDVVDLAGPYGDFRLAKPEDASRKYLFIATGVGIAPFHCFVRSYHSLDYRVVHGVSFLEERYDMDDYARSRYVGCVTREDGGDYSGRVNDYLREHKVDNACICYICGHAVMVAEVYDILRTQGVPADNLFTEVFF